MMILKRHFDEWPMTFQLKTIRQLTVGPKNFKMLILFLAYSYRAILGFKI
jgi:hypothetical protein